MCPTAYSAISAISSTPARSAQISAAQLPESALIAACGDAALPAKACLSGGDDYELLFAAPARQRDAIASLSACSPCRFIASVRHAIHDGLTLLADDGNERTARTYRLRPLHRLSLYWPFPDLPSLMRPTVRFPVRQTGAFHRLPASARAVAQNPGTAGTLAARALFPLLASPCGTEFLACTSGLHFGVIVSERTGRALGVSDHGAIVWDEKWCPSGWCCISPRHSPCKARHSCSSASSTSSNRNPSSGQTARSRRFRRDARRRHRRRLHLCWCWRLAARAGAVMDAELDALARRTGHWLLERGWRPRPNPAPAAGSLKPSPPSPGVPTGSTAAATYSNAAKMHRSMCRPPRWTPLVRSASRSWRPWCRGAGPQRRAGRPGRVRHCAARWRAPGKPVVAPSASPWDGGSGDQNDDDLSIRRRPGAGATTGRDSRPLRVCFGPTHLQTLCHNPTHVFRDHTMDDNPGQSPLPPRSAQIKSSSAKARSCGWVTVMSPRHPDHPTGSVGRHRLGLGGLPRGRWSRSTAPNRPARPR